MKKTLLFIGLAMCTSLAFAQTNNYTKAKSLDKMTVSMKAADARPVDYKASIFTKAVGDTIKVWNFTNEPGDMPTVYGTNGRVTSGMTVAGEQLEVNSVSENCATWQYVPDTNWFNGQFFNNNYPILSTGWRPVTGYMIEDLGPGQFMMISFRDFNANAGFPNAYMSFAPVATPEGTEVIRIAIKQEYRKYYDQCWVDYKVGNSWNTREVNVTGVDLDVNSWGAVNTIYTMPLELVNQPNIEIRVRYSGTSRSVQVHGYFWAIGQIALIEGDPDAWIGYGQTFVDGAYGTMPKDMSIPLTWISSVSNNGANTRTGIQTVASHILNGDTTVIASAAAPDVPAGDPSETFNVFINERGFINPNDADAFSYNGWFAYGLSGAYGSSSLPNGYQGGGLNTSTPGLNKVQVSVTSTGANSMYWPAIPYRVVTNTNSPINENLETGYRWAHDNGVIAAASGIAGSYTLGKVIENGTPYITDSGHYGDAGYQMLVRYTTPNVIPTDANGDPWVLLGVELITSAGIEPQELEGTVLSPMCYYDSYTEDSSISFQNINTGINGLERVYRGEDLENYRSTGYVIADQNGDYNAATFFFPEQPELTPSTSFRLGYTVAYDGKFAVAKTRSSALMPAEEGGYAYTPIDSIAATAGYGRFFTPNQYDILLYDPVHSESFWAAWYDDTYPMVRAIVGPRRELPRHNVYVDCQDGQSIMTWMGDTVCGLDFSVAEGGSPTVYIFGGNDHAVLDHLYIDDVEVFPATNENIDGDENFYTEGNDDVIDTIDGEEVTHLIRNYWSYTFANIDASHRIRATSHYEDWDENNSVDPVAAEVRLLLAPNPATSKVAIALKGVTGMVNCSIIDMSGRVVYNNTINAERSTSIDLSNVPAGAYFVRINNDSFVKVEKLIVR